MAYRTWVEIDLKKLRKNLLSIKKAARGRKLGLTIKANAYGHGSIPIAKHTEDKADLFVVADVPEAVELRDAGIKKPILILKPLLEREEILFVAQMGFRALLAHEEELNLLIEVTEREKKPLFLHMEIDTGMSRTGLSLDSLNFVFDKIRKHPLIKLEGIFTHFATADYDEFFVREQLFRFWKIIKSMGRYGLIPRT